MAIRGRAVGLTLAALVVAGCVRTAATPAEVELRNAPALPGATLVVENRNVDDVDVFLVRDGEILARLGMVDGESTARFPVDAAFFPTGTLGLYARAIGAPGTARSGPVLVTAGQTVTFTIQPDLAACFATVR